jgi:hypothetical protein
MRFVLQASPQYKAVNISNCLSCGYNTVTAYCILELVIPSVARDSAATNEVLIIMQSVCNLLKTKGLTTTLHYSKDSEE